MLSLILTQTRRLGHRQENPFRHGDQNFYQQISAIMTDHKAESSISCQLDLLNSDIVDRCLGYVSRFRILTGKTTQFAARSLLNVKVSGIILLSTSRLGRRF